MVKVCRVTERTIMQGEWLDAVGDDPVLQKLIEEIQNGWSSELNKNSELDGYWKIRQLLSCEIRVVLCGMRLFVPVALSERIMKLGHEGHQGMGIMKTRVGLNYW